MPCASPHSEGRATRGVSKNAPVGAAGPAAVLRDAPSALLWTRRGMAGSDPWMQIALRGGRRYHRGLARARSADDRLLDLHHEEEDHAAEDEPRPDAKWQRLGLEHGLQRRRVGVEELEHNDRADAHRQIAIAEMGHWRQRRVDLEPAVQEIKDLPDDQSVDGGGARARVGRALRLYPEERPKREGERQRADEDDAPDAEGVEDLTIDHARRPQHHVKLVRLERD